MPENAPLTPLEAAAAIREMDGRDERVKARVHGLTWLFWAVASPAIFLTYAYAASAQGEGAPGRGQAWFGLLWLPWAAVGLAFTGLLWRTVGFAIPHKRLEPRELALHAGLFLLATVGLAAAGFGTGFRVYPPTLVLLGLGLATSALGVREAVATGGAPVARFQALVGVALMAFAVAEAAALAGDWSFAGLSRAALWNVAASGLALGAVGVFRIARA